MTKLLSKGDVIKVAASRGSGLLHQITTRDAGKACTSMEILGRGALPLLRRSSSGYWVINGAYVRLSRRWSGEGEEPYVYGILDKT